MKPHRGVLILVLGIVSLIMCQPLGIASWLMGNSDLEEMRAGRMDPSGEGMTQAGRILGIISIVLIVLGILAFIAMMVLGVAFSASQGDF